MSRKEFLEQLFHPKSIAIVGASANPVGHGHSFMNYILNYGFSGNIYPINPSQAEITGLKAYPDLEHVPGTIDHVTVAVSLNNVPSLLEQGARKGVKTMHIYAGRASETGRPEAKKLDAEILRLAREHNITIIGPNALGIFCPASGLAFGYDFPRDPGNVGAIMQSGANSTDLIHLSALRGIKFSKVVSYGNALDINEEDLLEYFTEDPETKILLCYIEGLRIDPEKYFKLVHKAASLKPVIICKGGRSKAGARWSLHHTASEASFADTWKTQIRQAGAILVRNLDEMVNMAVAFSFLAPIKGKRVGIGGGGGGTCVLSADHWEENGFEVPPLPQNIRDEFKRRGSQLWDWINNPADWSIVAPGDACTIEAVLLEMAKHPDFDFIAACVGEDHPFWKDHFVQEITANVEGYIRVSKAGHKPLLAIFGDRPLGISEMDSWRYRTFAKLRTRLIEEHVPFFPTVDQAAQAVTELINYYQKRS